MKEVILERIKRLVAMHTGVLLREHDDEALKKIIQERLRLLKLSTPEEYCQLLSSGADSRREQERLAVLLTTGETWFFRDQGQFALLRETILPELIERRKDKRSLRLWSAACSSGEEAYSLAMLLDELLPQRADWDLLILGSDINADAIEKARRGLYTQWSFRMTEPELQLRYFRPHNDAWELDGRIRAMVQFRRGNLLMDEFPDPAADLHDMDLILCRNTFIYLEPKVVGKIAAKLAAALAEGGYLITGHGELHAQHMKGLRTRIFPESVAYQKIADCGVRIEEQGISDFGVRIAEDSIADCGVRIADCGGGTSGAASGFNSAIRTPKSEIPCSAIESAWQHANLGELGRAAQICHEQMKAFPFDAEPYYLLAQIAQERGDAAAKELLKRAVYLDPAFVAAYLELGEIYAAEGDASRARKMRAAARGLLKTMPAEQPVAALGAVTAGEALLYLEQLE